MNSSVLLLVAADAVLAIHAAFVVFVILGLIAILVGKILAWSWVRNFWFRVIHLAAIFAVVAQAWLGIICPLTTLEMALRSRAGDVTYTGAFVAHWIESWLYYQAPAWVFAVSYTIFGIAVAVSWYWVPPARRQRSRRAADSSL